MTSTATERSVPRLKQRYNDEIRSDLQTELGLGNVMQVPGLVKIVVNMGVGDAARDSKVIDGAVRDLATITGQKPRVTKSRKSIAQFKLREDADRAHTTSVATGCGSSTGCYLLRYPNSRLRGLSPSSSTVTGTTPSA
jgi:large subunit ribosomal protein L5